MPHLYYHLSPYVCFFFETPSMLSQLTFSGCNFHSYATVPLHTWPQRCSLSKENQLCDSGYFTFQMVQTTSERPSFGFSELKRRSNLVTLDRGAPGRGRAVRPIPHIHLLLWAVIVEPTCRTSPGKSAAICLYSWQGIPRLLSAAFS